MARTPRKPARKPAPAGKARKQALKKAASKAKAAKAPARPKKATRKTPPTAGNKPTAKKPVGKKPAAKKRVAKKAAPKTSASAKRSPGKPAAKRSAKPSSRKPVAKRAPVGKPAANPKKRKAAPARKPAVKPARTKAAAPKKASRKAAAKKFGKKTVPKKTVPAKSSMSARKSGAKTVVKKAAYRKPPAIKKTSVRKVTRSAVDKASTKRAAKASAGAEITSVLDERRLFPPPAEFAKQAHIGSREEYDRLRAEAEKDPDGFWARQAESLHWFRKWDRVLEWKEPFAKWFVGGKINVSYNCIDRHLADKADKPAIVWEGEPGDERTLTYRQLHEEVCRFANALKAVGVQTGDRVAIYMPMIPAAAIAMLACTRIGATHSIVFGGFSADALRDRIQDAGAKVVVTADGGYRGGRVVPLKDAVDEAVEQCPTIEKVIVFKRTGQGIKWNDGRDVWASELLAGASAECEAVPLDSEHPLFILYTSGTTGKPKGILHTTGGYLLGAALTTKWVFDLKDSDKYWCTADIGWVTGHSYVVYGPLANGATTFMYEGAPTTPKPDRFWDIIERHKLTIFYTAPTAIRAFIKAGDPWPQGHDLSSLRLLGSVGEPINPEAWMWYHRVIGKERCPIVDTWWQTETGTIMISPLPGVTPTTPGSATLPLPGIDAEVVDAKGKPVARNKGGLLVIRKPWPSMLRTIWGDDERYRKQYWSHVKGFYFSGDGARRDDNGYFWVLGRVDDVLNVSGHRLGTAEIESALVSHPTVAEAAVVGRPDDLKGTAIAAFVIPRGRTAEQANADASLRDALRAHVAKEIGPIAKPDDIRFTDALPKTRSGKIMRRLLRDLAAGTKLGDTTTLEDARVLEILREQEEGDEE